MVTKSLEPQPPISHWVQQHGCLVSPQINLGGSNDAANFTISTWFKDLHPTSEGWRTLMRGAQGNHHVIIQNTNRVGVFHNWQGNFRPTASFDLTPAMTTNWRHLMAVSGGGVTTFYLDAVKMGTSDRQTGNNIYALEDLMEHRNLPNIWTIFGYIPRSWGRQMLKFFTMMVMEILVRLPIL